MMIKYFPALLLLLLLFLSSCKSTHTNPDLVVNCDSADRSNSAINFAQNFFTDHRWFFSDPDIKSVNLLYTEEFGQVIKNHAECVAENGICNIDFDPWINAQDGYIDSYIQYSISASKNALVSVSLDYLFRVHPEYPAKKQNVLLNLNKAAAPLCWKLDDMIMPEGSSMKEMMQDGYRFYYYKKNQASWRFISSGIQSSKISVHRGDKLIGEYDLNCDVSESLTPDPSQLEGEMNRVGIVSTASQPQGLLISSCRVGAHSKQLAVYDLSSDSLEPAWTKTGSYFAEWSVNANYELVLSYDMPCSELRCSAPFKRVNVLWNDL